MSKVLEDFAARTHNVNGYMSDFAPSMTRQEFAEECDINTIMAKYEAGGAISHVNKAEPMFVDWTQVPDLREGLDIFRGASEAFYSLPAKVRRDFDNDPAEFVKFAQDPANLEKMREYGLAPPAAEPPAPIRVEVTNQAPASNDNAA